MAELDGEELTAEDLLQSLPLVVSSAGELTSEFGFCSLPIDSGARIQLVPVALVDSKLLVAVPRTSWHKKVAQRVLPSNALQKPAMVEVDAVFLNDRLVEPVSSMKIWMGFLEPGLLMSLEEDADPDSFDYAFVPQESEPMVPTAVALKDAAQEHFAFVSATEFPDPEEEASGLGMFGRVERLEGLVEGLANSVATLVSKMDNAGAASSLAPPPPVPKRPSVLRNAGAKAAGSGHVTFDDKFPMMDPSAVTAALQAGVDEDSLREMQKLLGSAAPAVRRLKEPAASSVPKASARSTAQLSETESEKEVSGNGTPSGAPATVEHAVTQLAEIVGVLAADRLKKKRTSRVLERA